jgi:hypothetical protein
MVQRMNSPIARNEAKKYIFRPSDALMRALLAAAMLIGILVVTLSMAMAQDRSQARQACEADYRKLCTGIIPGAGRARKCLNDNLGSLSEACKQVVAASVKK